MCRLRASRAPGCSLVAESGSDLEPAPLSGSGDAASRDRIGKRQGSRSRPTTHTAAVPLAATRVAMLLRDVFKRRLSAAGQDGVRSWPKKTAPHKRQGSKRAFLRHRAWARGRLSRGDAVCRERRGGGLSRPLGRLRGSLLPCIATPIAPVQRAPLRQPLLDSFHADVLRLRPGEPDGARFCLACGTALQAAPSARGAQGRDRALRRPRRLHVAGRAARSGGRARAARSVPQRLRWELERFGGTVEKFIGDAVMALFGAPVAHEDDPERAVRAALAIRDWAREEERTCRCGSR